MEEILYTYIQSKLKLVKTWWNHMNIDMIMMQLYWYCKSVSWNYIKLSKDPNNNIWVITSNVDENQRVSMILFSNIQKSYTQQKDKSSESYTKVS